MGWKERRSDSTEYGDKRGWEKFIPNPQATLREQLREVMRFLHYSPRTEATYWQWITRFLRHHRQAIGSGGRHGWRHPREMGAAEVRDFLTHLAAELNVAASTQNQALNAHGHG